MLRYCRRVLNVKATTSNIMVCGECGMLPPSVQCTISTMCYMNRLYHMPGGTIAKRVYEELNKLHSIGFTTWVTRVNEVITNHGLDITKLPSNFRIECQNVVITQFKTQWDRDMHNIETYPIFIFTIWGCVSSAYPILLWWSRECVLYLIIIIKPEVWIINHCLGLGHETMVCAVCLTMFLRTYIKYKSSFVIEPYLYMLKNHKYRVAVAQLRISSHTLAIERGRYARPKVQICDRTCNVCGILEDEAHFLIRCSLYKREREVLFSNVLKIHPGFSDMSDENKFVFLLENTDQQVLTWVGKFIYKSFKTRAEELL